ncbi:hypothetical protein ACOMHN_055502 [Nucella lapillus]
MDTSTTADNGIPSNTTAISWTADTKSLETQIAILLWKVWSPCLLALGSFGNIATIFVMRRIKDKNSSQHIILMSLAASDFSLLYTSVLRQWLYFLFRLDMYDLHTVVCKLSWWLIYVASTTSSWLLTCLTIQRTMAVTWPHKMRLFCSMRRTRIVIACIVCFAFVLHSHFVFGMEISGNKCTFRSVEYEDFIERIWAWEELAVFTLVPSLCLIICNVMLSMALFKSTSTISATVYTVSSTNTAQISTTRRKTASRTTVMILALSCTFLVLTLPVCVYLIWDYYKISHTTQNTRLWAREGLAFAVTMLLWYTNSAVNFLLYVFTGTRFRREFLNWICCAVQTPSKTSVNHSGSRFSGDKRTR